MASSENVLTISGLNYRWPGARGFTLSINRLSLKRGETLYLRGASGSGKSTLLAAIAGVVDLPPQTVEVNGVDVGRLRGGGRDRFRADNLGMLFQLFNLLPWLSAVDNVLLPCRFSASRRERAGPSPSATAERLLGELGLGEPGLIHSPAGQLSVGQQQRVAAARALIGSPGLVLADEPTSALDESAKGTFVELLLRECSTAGASLLFVSHDRTLEPHFDRVLELGDLQEAAA
ncbi:MAG: ATP-binding cassette domain-containing protein [Pseudomonadota bacterium]